METSSSARIFVAALAALIIGVLPVSAQEPLTLAQAVARALERNPELAADGPGQAAARSELSAGRAGRRPRLDFELNYGGGNNPVYVFGSLLTQGRFTEANFALPALNHPAALDNVQTRVTVQQNIWDFGRTSESLEQARLGVELADRGHADHRRRIVLAAIEAYYVVSLTAEAWEASRVALQSAESIVQQAQARFDSGFAVEADLLRAQASLAAARQREIEARGQHEAARAALNRIMGQPLDTPLGQTARLSPAHLPVPDENALAAEQHARRTDYQVQAAEVRLAEAQLRARKSEFYPVLAGFASWETDNPSWVDYGGNNWLAGVSLRWNAFAGGGDSARLEAARQRLEQKRRQLAAADSGMQLELRQALIQTRSAEQQVQVAQAAERQSEESLKILRNRYDAGLATMTDLLSAETARAAARTAAAESVCRHRLSYARLEFAAGTLDTASASMNP